MAYIENPFSVGQSVVCINDYFPLVIATAGKDRIGSLPPVYPKLNETIVVDEILGEFLRFDKYDCDDVNHPDYGWRWWKHTHFSAVNESIASDAEKSGIAQSVGISIMN
jgi:hypothetical protein